RARSSLRHNQDAVWGRDRGGGTWNGSGGHRRWPGGAVPCGRFTKQARIRNAQKHCAARDRARWPILAWRRIGRADGTSPRRQLMPAIVDNASQNSAPFVDQRPNGPGVSKIDPSHPAAPMYRLLAKMRSPVTLRDLMIHPVRTGYIGQEQPLTAAELPKSAAELYPEIGVSEVAVPSPAGRIRCQVFSPPASKPRGGPRPMMLYLHGGGFTVGQSEDTAYITSRIAAENAMVVVSANYRLAPEWPFPACLDDCLAVLQWMEKNGATFGGDGTRIGVGGDSAGGNLAAALVIKARDEGVSPPQTTVLLAPITDFFFEQHESFARLEPLGIVTHAAFMLFVRGAYLVHGKNWAHPHASPARADLRNYPPTFIATGTADPLVDDNRVFAQKLRAAGVGKVEHFVREGMPHGFYFFPA